MAINYETILSSYDDRLTLLEFMNRVLDALENASVDASHFTSLGNGQYTFSIDFADGSTVESAPVTINGAKGVSSFSASNGVLSIGLTDGSTLTANPFNGNITINGDLEVNGDHIDLNGPVKVADQDGLDVTGPLSVSGNVSVGGDLHVVTQLDVDDESDFAGHVEMHNGLHIINTDLTVDGKVSCADFSCTNIVSKYNEDEGSEMVTIGAWTVISDYLEVSDDVTFSTTLYCDQIKAYRYYCEPAEPQSHSELTVTCDAAAGHNLGSILNIYFRGSVEFGQQFQKEPLIDIVIPESIGTRLSSTIKQNNKPLLWTGRLYLLKPDHLDETGEIDAYLIKESNTLLSLVLYGDNANYVDSTPYFMGFSLALPLDDVRSW